MLPNDALSVSAVVAPFLGSRGMIVSKKVDYNDGPVAIQDTSEGLLYQTWTMLVVGDRVTISAPNTPEITLFEAPGITEASFTFDQNARYLVVFVQNSECKMFWFDSSIVAYTITNYGTTYTSPRIDLDDKRRLATLEHSTNDVIFAYIRDGGLYYRQQRERFGVERLLTGGVPSGLIKIGMNIKLRMQFMLEPS